MDPIPDMKVRCQVEGYDGQLVACNRCGIKEVLPGQSSNIVSVWESNIGSTFS